MANILTKAEANTKTVLITGGTGYLGSRLIGKLIWLGFRVAVLKRQTSSVSLIKSKKNLKFFDIEDGISIPFEVLESLYIVIHTATCYGRMGEKENDIMSTNFHLPKKILDLCNKHNTPLFFNCDTSLPSKANSYAKYKKLFRSHALENANKRKVRFVNMQLEYFYGPFESETKLPALIIKSCLHQRERLSLSPGNQVRDFIHIDDVLSAFSQVIINIENYKNNFFLEYQVGLGHPCTVKKFAKTIKRLSNSSIRLDFGAVPYRPNEIMKSVADNKSLKEVGWSPLYNIENGLQKVISDEKGSARKLP
tara:strand:- start:547 stop:1470 length:924 start_codon:yes stop_codon:yes gene_type:complete